MSYTSQWPEYIPTHREPPHSQKQTKKQAAPELWDAAACPRVITEYGRSLTAKAGWAVSRVEYAFDNQPAPEVGYVCMGMVGGCESSRGLFVCVVGVCVCDATQIQQPITRNLKTQPPASAPLPASFLRTAILHVGADALLRECYCPAKFPHRVGVFECVCFG